MRGRLRRVQEQLVPQDDVTRRGGILNDLEGYETARCALQDYPRCTDP
jgi:hypothetical protein